MALPSFFVGVWRQPAASYVKWAAEGVNVAIGPDTSGSNVLAARKAAVDAGMYYVDVPMDAADVERMVADPKCLMLMLPDEPELNAPWYAPDPGPFNAWVAAFMAKYRLLFLQVAGRKKIWANFAGGNIVNARPWYKGELQKPFGALADIVSGDIYPANGGWNGVGENPVTTMLNCLKEYFPGKPLWSYLEVCDQKLGQGGRGPTPQEMQAQVDIMLAQGVKGIVYFSHQPQGSGLPWDAAAKLSAWDARTDEQRAKCKEIALKLTGPVVAPVSDLQKQIDVLNARVTQLEAKKVPSGVQLIYS